MSMIRWSTVLAMAVCLFAGPVLAATPADTLADATKQMDGLVKKSSDAVAKAKQAIEAAKSKLAKAEEAKDAEQIAKIKNELKILEGMLRDLQKTSEEINAAKKQLTDIKKEFNKSKDTAEKERLAREAAALMVKLNNSANTIDRKLIPVNQYLATGFLPPVRSGTVTVPVTETSPTTSTTVSGNTDLQVPNPPVRPTPTQVGLT
jgi:uncharacterized phage infection (PIP) family protein YhgE